MITDVQGRTFEIRPAGELGRAEADRLDQPRGRHNLVRLTIRGYRTIEFLLSPRQAEDLADALASVATKARQQGEDCGA